MPDTPRRRDAERAHDAEGREFVKVTRLTTVHGEALITLLDYRWDADPGPGHWWAWQLQSVVPLDRPDVRPVLIEWEPGRSWHVIGGASYPQRPHGWADAVTEAMARHNPPAS